MKTTKPKTKTQETQTKPKQKRWESAIIPPIKHCCGQRPNVRDIENTDMHAIICRVCGRRQDGYNFRHALSPHTVSLWNMGCKPPIVKTQIKTVKKVSKKTAKKGGKKA